MSPDPELTDSAKAALARAAELLLERFSGEITLRCHEGGVKGWRISVDEGPGTYYKYKG